MTGNASETGMLIVLSGPSGVGKDEVMKRSMIKMPSLRRVVTYCADRGPRPGEVDGVDYHFISPKKFYSMVKNEEFMEYNITPGLMKGTSKGDLEEVLNGEKVIWRIDPDKACRVKKEFMEKGHENLVPLTQTIYIGTPTIRELWRRISGRPSDETKEKRIKRLKFDWETWLRNKGNFDHVLINETGMLDNTVNQFLGIVTRAS